MTPPNSIAAALDETHDVQARSWLSEANGHADFPVQNLPLGLFSTAADNRRRGGMAIGDHILDLGEVAPLLSGEALLAATAANRTTLNDLLALPAMTRCALRRSVFRLLTDITFEPLVRPALLPAADCELHVPARIGDYTDFYTGIHHAEHVGRLFRPDAPLLPNYKYVPIGYHGRSSTIEVSGATVIRPKAQTKAPEDSAPVYRASQRLDYEPDWIRDMQGYGCPGEVNGSSRLLAAACALHHA